MNRIIKKGKFKNNKISKKIKKQNVEELKDSAIDIDEQRAAMIFGQHILNEEGKVYFLNHNTKNDRKIADLVLDTRPEYIELLGDEIKNDFQFAIKVLEKEPYSIDLLGEEILNEEMFAKEVLEKKSDYIGLLGNNIKNNLEFAKMAFEKDPDCIRKLGNIIRNDRKFAVLVLRIDARYIKYLEKEIKNDKVFADIVLKYAPRQISFLGDDIRNDFDFIEKVLLKSPNNINGLGDKVFETGRGIFSDEAYNKLIKRFKKKYSNFSVEEKNELIDKNITDIELIALYKLSQADNSLKDKIEEKLLSRISITEGEIKKEKLEYIIKKALDGDIRVESLNNIIDEDTYRYVRYLGDIITKSERDFIKNAPKDFIKNTNKEKYKPILKLVQEMGLENSTEIAYQMFYTLGDKISMDLLKGKYGNIGNRQVLEMFSKIDIRKLELKKQNKGYVPILNENVIRIVFGTSLDEQDTPIKNYRNLKCSWEKRLEAEKIVERFYRLHDEWPIINEEFIRKQKLHKLSGETLRKTPKVINEILDLIEGIKEGLDEIDYKLKTSKVLKHISDTRFTETNNKTVIKRVIELSKLQEKVIGKHFSNIEEEEEEYILSVIGPQDRDILALGYETNCCFKACGWADNFGTDNKSLLAYCAATKYGGGIIVTEKETGKTIMGSPILRNGNMLMVHSMESLGMTDEEREKVHIMLKAWSDKIINETTKQENEGEDGIKAVLITDFQKVSIAHTKGTLSENRFNIYVDDNNKFTGYNNLGSNHHVLAIKEGVTEKDLIQGKPVKKLYEYPENIITKSISLEDKEKALEIVEMKKLISSLYSIREKELKTDFAKAEETLTIIKKRKEQFLVKFKENVFKFDEYKEMLGIIDIIDSKTKNRNKDINDVIQVKSGNGWYIAKIKKDESSETKIVCNYFDDLPESSKKTFKEELEKELKLQTGESKEVNIEDYKIKINEKEEQSTGENFVEV